MATFTDRMRVKSMRYKYCSNSLLLIVLLTLSSRSHAQVTNKAHRRRSNLIANYDDTGRSLPAGVPREIDTNGKVIYVPIDFTTSLYRDAALQLIIQEANEVAKDLNLTNDLPITESNILESFIAPFGFSYAYRCIGSVTTRNYVYYVSQDNSFSYLEGTHQLEECRDYLKDYCWRTNLIDTNAAFQLATQWLTAVHMDMAALERDCQVSISVDIDYVHAPSGWFVPIYWLAWIPTNNESLCAADVRLCEPAKTLLQLRVEDAKYILRKPLVFTNLSSLFPGVGRVHVKQPVKTITLPAPPP